MSDFPLRRHARRHRLAMRSAAGMLSVFCAVSGFPFASSIPSASAAAGAVDGVVFEDYNQNGTRQTSEPGLAGVTVTLTASDGTAVTTTSAANGSYTLAATDGSAYRLEFSGAPTGMFPSQHGADNATTVQFVTAPVTTNAAFAHPSDYCQADPSVSIACMLQTPTSGKALVTNAYSATGQGNSGTQIASQAQVGSTYGVAWNRKAKRVYQSSFFKRGVALGSSGLGGIYSVDPTGATAPAALATIPNTGTDPRPATPDWTRDAEAYSSVYKIGLGDIETSADNATLFAVNLNDNGVYSVGLAADGSATGTVSGPAIVALPGDCTTSQFHVFGLGIKRNTGYLSGVCSGPTASDMRGYVFSFDASGPVSTIGATQLTFPLTYKHGQALGWTISTNEAEDGNFLPWDMVTSEVATVVRAKNRDIAASQAQITDIEFTDSGDMILGIRDRFGDQTGQDLLGLTGTTTYRSASAGDLLIACGGPGAWTLESNGSCGGRTGTGVGNNQGPGGGEYYSGETFGTYHQETSLGSALRVPGTGEIMVAVFDPSQVRQQGTYRMTDAGGRSVDNAVFATDEPGTFGKANGLGDLEALCDQAPIEIGNRIWVDFNRDGIQDPTDTGLAGVKVDLYKGAVLVGSTTTAADGTYYFNNSNVNQNGATQIVPGATDYEIRIPNASGASQQAELLNLKLTAANVAGTGNDVRDSDAGASDTTPTTAVIAVPATAIAVAGQNDHTFDAGFMPSYSLGNRVWIDNDNSGALNGAEVGVDGVKVTLYQADAAGKPTGAILATDTTKAGGFYRFDDLGAGDYVVVIAAMNFTTGMPLAGYNSSTGAAQEADANLNGDNNDNGIDTVIAAGEVGAGGIASSKITLGGLSDEPSEEASVEADRPETTIDSRSNLTVDFGFNKRYELGNRVFFDTNNNGLMDTDELGMSAIKVSLYKAVAGKPVCAPIGSATTDSNGRYLFTNLLPGDYIVGIDGTNFAAGSPLDERFSSTGAGQNANPNTDIDSDDNGIDTPVTDACAKDSIISGVVTLAGDEKTGETDKALPGTGTPDTQSNLTVDFGFYSNAAVFQLGNRVFMDADNSGNMNGTEMPIANAKVSLYKADAAGNPTGVAIATDVTDAAGFYRFDNLDAGDYVVVIDRANFAKDGVLFGKGSSTGAAQKADANTDIDRDDNGLDTPLAAGSVNPGGIRSGKVTLGPGNTEPTGETELDAVPLGNRDFRSNLTVDFGFQTLPKHSLGNTVWVDENNNGKIDPSEKGLADVCVKVYGAGIDGIIGNADDELLGESTTDANGNYLFTNLVAGDYIVEICAPDGYVSSTGTNGSATGPFEGDATPSPESTPTDSDDNGTTVSGTKLIRSKPVTLGNGEPTAEVGGTGITDPNPDNRSDVTVDFGLFKPSAIGNFVWLDKNQNGKQDAGEPGVPGVKVQLLDVAGNLVAETTTDNDGKYLFDFLKPVAYKVQFVKSSFPVGTSLTTLNIGDDAADSDAMDSGMTDTYLLAPGERNLTVDAGLFGDVVLVPVVPAVAPVVPATTVAPTTVAPTTQPAPTTTPAPAPTTVVVKPKNALVVKVFEDTNKDGKSGSGEAGINTAVVELVDPSGKVTRVPVNPDGTIRLEGIPAGEYTVRVVSIGIDGQPTTKVLGKVIVPEVGEAQIEFGYAIETLSADLAFTGFATWRLMFLGLGMILVGSTFVRRTKQE